MVTFIDGFSCEVVPKQNPGEKTGICNEGYLFIYMTGSGAWSHLIEQGALDTLIGEAESKIQMGYNQLWVFEKKFCAAPARGDAGSGIHFDEKRREYPQELGRHLWPGRLYVVLQDPEGAERAYGPHVPHQARRSGDLCPGPGQSAAGPDHRWAHAGGRNLALMPDGNAGPMIQPARR